MESQLTKWLDTPMEPTQSQAAAPRSQPGQLMKAQCLERKRRVSGAGSGRLSGGGRQRDEQRGSSAPQDAAPTQSFPSIRRSVGIRLQVAEGRRDQPRGAPAVDNKGSRPELVRGFSRKGKCIKSWKKWTSAIPHLSHPVKAPGITEV